VKLIQFSWDYRKTLALSATSRLNCGKFYGAGYQQAWQSTSVGWQDTLPDSTYSFIGLCMNKCGGKKSGRRK